MRAMDIRNAEPKRTEYERRGGRGWGAYISRGGEARRVGSEGALGDAASISTVVVSYQADLRSRVSRKDPLAY